MPTAPLLVKGYSEYSRVPSNSIVAVLLVECPKDLLSIDREESNRDLLADVGKLGRLETDLQFLPGRDSRTTVALFQHYSNPQFGWGPLGTS